MFGFIPTLVSAAPGFKSSTAGLQMLLDCAIGEPALGVPIIIRFATALLLVKALFAKNTLASSPPLLCPTMFTCLGEEDPVFVILLRICCTCKFNSLA